MTPYKFDPIMAVEARVKGSLYAGIRKYSLNVFSISFYDLEDEFDIEISIAKHFKHC